MKFKISFNVIGSEIKPTKVFKLRYKSFKYKICSVPDLYIPQQGKEQFT